MRVDPFHHDDLAFESDSLTAVELGREGMMGGNRHCGGQQHDDTCYNTHDLVAHGLSPLSETSNLLASGPLAGIHSWYAFFLAGRSSPRLKMLTVSV